MTMGSWKIGVTTFVPAWICVLAVSYAAAQPAAPTAADIRIKVDDYMNAAVQVNGFSGSIFVAQHGQPVVSKGYGMASIELAGPNTPRTVFRLGSITTHHLDGDHAQKVK
jgi:CubicO group peptidase (beta-lactamase class C family)